MAEKIITHCSDCGQELEPEFPDFDEAVEQYVGALEIRFHGGFGMFIDPIDEEHRGILCFECADKLCCEHKWIRRLLVPRMLLIEA